MGFQLYPAGFSGLPVGTAFRDNQSGATGLIVGGNGMPYYAAAWNDGHSSQISSIDFDNKYLSIVGFATIETQALTGAGINIATDFTDAQSRQIVDGLVYKAQYDYIPSSPATDTPSQYSGGYNATIDSQKYVEPINMNTSTGFNEDSPYDLHAGLGGLGSIGPNAFLLIGIAVIAFFLMKRR